MELARHGFPGREISQDVIHASIGLDVAFAERHVEILHGYEAGCEVQGSGINRYQWIRSRLHPNILDSQSSLHINCLVVSPIDLIHTGIGCDVGINATTELFHPLHWKGLIQLCQIEYAFYFRIHGGIRHWGSQGKASPQRIIANAQIKRWNIDRQPVQVTAGTIYLHISCYLINTQG